MTSGANFQAPQETSNAAIGVIIDSVGSSFAARTVEDLITAAEEHGLRPIFYFGGFLEKGKTAGPFSYSYTLPDPEEIKALLVLPNSVSPWSPKASVNLIQEQYPEVPIYSLFEHLPNCCSVWADEADAIVLLFRHLLDGHLYKKFAFVMGPDSPESLSRRRLNKIREILDTYHTSVEPNDIFYGTNSTEAGQEAVKKILAREENAPDVLVCMSDQATIGAIKEFLYNGISVPEDIAIVGFDDFKENIFLPCSFTAIDSPIWECTSAMIGRIASDISGKTTYSRDNVVLKAHFLRRESCGCTAAAGQRLAENAPSIFLDPSHASQATLKRDAVIRKTLEDVLENCIATKVTASFSDFVHQTIQDLLRSRNLTDSFLDIFSAQWTVSLLRHQDFDSQTLINSLFVDAFRLLIQAKTTIFSRIHANDMGTLGFYQNCNALIGQNLTVHKALQAIGANLPQLGINRCIIVFIHPDKPEIGEIRLNYLEGRYTEIPETGFTLIPIKKLVENGISAIKEPMGVLTIAQENSVYGYILLSISEKHFDQFSLIQKTVSQIVDSAMTKELISTHIQSLTQKNTILSRMSLVDELTGLCNRRALYVTGRNMYQKAITEGTTSCFIFLDMDGLKMINDSFGHKEGDTAILSLANILKTSFRENDLLVRYGGDEFVVLMVNIHAEILNKTLARITENIDKFNKQKAHTWTLGVSWGYVFNEAHALPKSFESIIEESDAHLYKEKRKKKGIL